MLFKKKNKDDTIDKAIIFIKQQKELNKKNMQTIRGMNFKIDDMKEWDRIYDFILSTLKSMRK